MSRNGIRVSTSEPNSTIDRAVSRRSRWLTEQVPDPVDRRVDALGLAQAVPQRFAGQLVDGLLDSGVNRGPSTASTM